MNTAQPSLSSFNAGSPLPVAYPVEHYTHNTININLNNPANAPRSTTDRNLKIVLGCLAAGLSAGIIGGAVYAIAEPHKVNALTFPVCMFGGVVAGLSLAFGYVGLASQCRAAQTTAAVPPVVNAQIDQSMNMMIMNAHWANI